MWSYLSLKDISSSPKVYLAWNEKLLKKTICSSQAAGIGLSICWENIKVQTTNLMRSSAEYHFGG